MPLLLKYIILTDWEYGQNFDANVKSNVFKLEERPYFDEICAHSWSEIRVGSKKLWCFCHQMIAFNFSKTIITTSRIERFCFFCALLSTNK